MLLELELPKPLFKRRISALETIQGSPIQPIERVKLMSSAEYEDFILEWTYGFLMDKYSHVRSFAGAGDKGRDIVGSYNDGSIDIYQCKHYADKISPSVISVELGKLCHYTFNNHYPLPKAYYIVAPRGCGPLMLDLIANPKNINSILIENWSKYCENEISSKTTVKLEGKFEEYVKKFDFSIIKDIAPHELISQFEQTSYFPSRFGGGIRKYREVIPSPEKEIQHREQNYVTELFAVYQQRLGVEIKNLHDLELKSSDLLTHFNNQRSSFYCSESLEKFSRDNFPDADPLPFDELKEDAHSVVNTTLQLHEDKTGYERILYAFQEVKRQLFINNPLAYEIKPFDKEGVCHYLVNEEKLKWVIEK